MRGARSRLTFDIGRIEWEEEGGGEEERGLIQACISFTFYSVASEEAPLTPIVST